MADGTRGQDFKILDESIRLLKEGYDGHGTKMEEIKNSLKNHSKEMGEIKHSLKDLGDIKELMTAVSLKYDQIAAHVYGKKQPQETPKGRDYQMEIIGSSHHGFDQPHSQSSPAFGTRYAKIDFPKFFGEDPIWVGL